MPASFADDRFSLSRLATWSLAVGGVLAVLGGLAIAAPWTAATVGDAVCGMTLIAGGVSQVGMSFGTWTWRGFWLALLCGALSIVAGTAMLAIPVEGVHALVTFLGTIVGINLLSSGIALLASGWWLRRDVVS